METLFLFIAKSSGLIALFFIAYYFLLRKETFFTANRWFLLMGLFTSVILPWIVFTTIVWVEPTANNLDWSNVPIMPIQKESLEINWNYVMLAIYSIGLLILIIKFAIDFYSLNSVLKGKNAQQQADFKFIDTTENIAPFSYFNTIVYNSSLYSESEMESILEHEKVHSEQYHTIDVLITRIFCILFWFNPFIWLYKKAILQNLEFIADSEAAKKISDKKAYQLTLLKITTHENCVVLTNHFYQSLIKKRIVMLNTNQSKKWNSWKYTLVIPALVAFVLLFQVEVIAQEKSAPKEDNKAEKTSDITSSKINKDPLPVTTKTVTNTTKTISNNGSNVTCKEISEDTKIFINGNKSDKVEMDKLNPKEIVTMNIINDNNEKEIRIVTKDGPINFNGKDMPTPPTPPTPPLLKTPQAPNFPKAPKTPKGDPVHGDKKAWKKFEKEIEEYDAKMKKLEPQMEAFDKEMAEFDKQMEPFNKQMEEFDKKMKVFEKEMEKYHSTVQN